MERARLQASSQDKARTFDLIDADGQCVGALRIEEGARHPFKLSLPGGQQFEDDSAYSLLHRVFPNVYFGLL